MACYGIVFGVMYCMIVLFVFVSCEYYSLIVN